MNKHPFRNYLIRTGLIMLAHFAALAVFLAGVAIIHLNDNYTKGFAWVNQSSYEDSPAFEEQMDRDIDSAIDYFKYRSVFGNGNVSMDDDAFILHQGPINTISFSFGEVIRLAKEKGYYLDDDYNFVIEPGADIDHSKDDVFSVEWTMLVPDGMAADGSSRPINLDEAIRLTLNMLSRYYRAENRFFEESHNVFFEIKASGLRVSNLDGFTSGTAEKYGRYAITDTRDLKVSTNRVHSPAYFANKALSLINEDYDEISIAVAVDTDYPKEDLYSEGRDRYRQQRDFYFYGLLAVGIGAFFTLFTFGLLCYYAGRVNKQSKELYLTALDQRSAEERVFIAIVLVILASVFADKVGMNLVKLVMPIESWEFGRKLFFALLIYVIAFGLAYSIVKTIKAGKLWETSLLRRCYLIISDIIRKKRYTFRLLLSAMIYLIVDTGLIMTGVLLIKYQNTLTDRFVVVGIIIVIIGFNLGALYLLSRNEIEIDKINEAIASIASGDIGFQLDMKEFTGKERDMAENINNISTGFESALNDSVKSERMRADLITNVSHDIKTPLTSIINYVDLIKKEKSDDPKIKEYVAILEQKSQYLKSLTEDLVEASKATSGTVSLDMTDIDLAELVNQANGEFEERYEERGLSIVSHIPDHQIMIRADGSRLWRVLENVYNNAYKYAAEGSRVYVDITENVNDVKFVIKNISANPLNISPDELTERFVRGDGSRTTEGHGLGLSIAKSLTKLQGGLFMIEIDGDLFKAVIKFNRNEKNEPVDRIEETL